MAWAGFEPCAAIFFDLDDTLVEDNGPAVEACWLDACAEAAELPQAELRQAIREISAWYWSDPDRHRIGRSDLLAATVEVVGRALAQLGAPDDELARRLAVRYRALRDERLALLDGAVETIAALGAAGYTLGMITNGAALAQRAKIERFALAAHFAYIGIEGEAGVGKPDAEAYRRALRAVGCEASAAWMVGDNLAWDIIAPQRLGLRTVWIDRHGDGLPAGVEARPDHTVACVLELHPRKALAAAFART